MTQAKRSGPAPRKPRSPAAPTTPPARSAPPPPARGHPRSLLALAGLPRAELLALLSATHAHALAAHRGESPRPTLAGKTVANLFFEDSTRTRLSFTLAAKRLGADVVDLGAASSVSKGESLTDTARVAEALGVHALVVRAKQSGAAAMIAGAVSLPVLSAGDGRHEHPTQGLLDCYTLAAAWKLTPTDAKSSRAFDFTGRLVAIVGDIASSRVARSAIAGLTALGAKVVCIGPPALCPSSLSALGCTVERDFDAALPSADAVMMLRVQFERRDESAGAHAAAPAPGASAIPKAAPAAAGVGSLREYREFYGLTVDRAALMKPGAFILHPGPVNRGLEIDGEVADGLRKGPASLILSQVRNGVFARMASLAWCLAAE